MALLELSVWALPSSLHRLGEYEISRFQLIEVSFMKRALLLTVLLSLPGSIYAEEFAHPASFMIGHKVHVTWVRPDNSLGGVTVRLVDVSPYGLVYKNGKHKTFRMWEHIVRLSCEVCTLPPEWQY